MINHKHLFLPSLDGQGRQFGCGKIFALGSALFIGREILQAPFFQASFSGPLQINLTFTSRIIVVFYCKNVINKSYTPQREGLD